MKGNVLLLWESNWSEYFQKLLLGIFHYSHDESGELVVQ